MKKLYIILFAIIVTGCSNNREVSVETSPMGSKFTYKNRQFTTPAVIELPLETDIVLTQEGYEHYTITNDSFGSEDYLKVKLTRLPKFKLDIKVENAKYYKVLIDNRKVSPSNIELYKGEYNIRITADGYEPFTKALNILKDEKLSIKMIGVQKKYSVKNIPEDIIEISFNGEKLMEGSTFKTSEEDFYLDYTTEDGEFKLNGVLDTYYMSSGNELNIEHLLKYQPVEVDNSLDHPIFEVEGEWVESLNEKITLKPKMFPTFGYGEDEFIPGPFEESDILKGPSGYFTLGSIINPSEYLVDAEMVITVGHESKTITLGTDILSKAISFKDIFQNSYISEDQGNLLETSVIDGVFIDQNPPYIGKKYTVEIIKNNKKYREIKGSVRVRDFSYNNIDITSNPKETVFSRPDTIPRNNKRYIYSQSKYNNGYLIAYKGPGFSGDTYWIPLFACRITQIDDSPVIITLKEDLKEALDGEGLFFCIAKTIEDVNIVSAQSVYK